MTDELIHEGTPRKSGRYPWGSGENPQQRNKDFLTYVEDLRKQGVPDKTIYEGLGMKSNELRQRYTIADTERRLANQHQAMILKEAGNSATAIGREMGGVNESTVRGWLNPAAQEKAQILGNTTATLKANVDEKRYLDIGEGTENHLGVSSTLLATSVRELTDQGYKVYSHKEPQIANPGQFTKYKVLGHPETTYKEMATNPSLIKTVAHYSEDQGKTFTKIVDPVNFDSKRLMVRYGDEGGAEKDGVIELRRGVDDISLGPSARYAQVRIGVDGTHYIKGMAMYSDNVPNGVDMIFNTTKSRSSNKLDALKPIKDEKGDFDPEAPFKSVIRQKHYVDKDGNEKVSVLNIVGDKDHSGEEGYWSTWSNKLSSQFLSKQPHNLAKQQLGLAFDKKKDQLDEILALTNPVIKRKLLDSFAQSADSSAVHLKAVGLPRTANHVILPINSLKDTEVYAPGYNNGERVVLVRHPHGGIFEIPELTVNNKNREANQVMKNAWDAVGINSKVAERLSGADFDGDTVLVIPQRDAGTNRIKTSPQLEDLKNFNPRIAYKGYDGMPVMSPKTKQNEMGKISNLITDMTIGGATQAELARAVKHSMVVIDAEKHKLNYKQSALDNNIKNLKAAYQGGSSKGASTIISRAKGKVTIPEKRPSHVSEGGPVNPLTGEKNWTPTGNGYMQYYKKGPNGERVPLKEPKWVEAKTQSKRMLETNDARTLIGNSNSPIENVYADHANRLKALANQARKASLETAPLKVDRSAKAVYSKEIDSLKAKLNVARKNSPLERQANLIANTQIKAKKDANPQMEEDRYKKIKYQEQRKARERVGAGKEPIKITDREWEAIQSGAITNNLLRSIVNNTNLDQVKLLATPRDRPAMPPAKLARANNMFKAGFTQAEIAQQLGVPTSTLNDALNR